jgi:hypothetical protein
MAYFQIDVVWNRRNTATNGLIALGRRRFMGRIIPERIEPTRPVRIAPQGLTAHARSRNPRRRPHGLSGQRQIAQDRSAPEARAFISAWRALLLLLPAESGDRGGHMRLNPELIQKEMDDVRKWLEGNDPTTGGPFPVPRIAYSQGYPPPSAGLRECVQSFDPIPKAC